MILKIKLFLVLCFFSNLAWGLSGTLTPVDQKNNQVEVGNIFNSKLVIDDEELLESDWTQVDKEKFSETFLLLDHQKISSTEYQVRLLLKEIPQTAQPLKAFVGSKELELKVTGFHFATVKNPPKDYTIQDQSLGWKRFLKKEYLYTFLAILILFSYPLGKIGRKLYLKKKNARERRLKKEYWQSFFYSAQRREEFEEIGKRKNEWLGLLKTKPEECQQFFSILENHQYKKEVNESDLQDIKQALNGMKDVFQRFGI